MDNNKDAYDTSRFVFTINDIRNELKSLRDKGLQRGSSVGFKELSDLWSIKEGSTTYILASPFSGKTTMAYEILMNLAEFEGKASMVYSPETGSAKDIYSELVWMYLRKPHMKSDNDAATDEEVEVAIKFIQEHFVVIDTLEMDASDKIIYQTAIEFEKSTGRKIDMLLIDSFSDVRLDYTAHRDISFGNFLTDLRRFASHNKIHTILTFHTKAQQTVEGKDVYGNKVRYYPPPTARDIQNGEYGYRKAFFLLGLWRTPYNVIDSDTGEPYPRNESRIEVLKVKPKKAGKMGMCKLYYDYKSNRFYESTDGDDKVFSSSQNK